MSNHTVGQWLHTNTDVFQSAGIESARLDCLLLLEHILGVDRAAILAHQEQILTDGQQAELEKSVARRLQHEPIAYIRGYSEFYGRTFIVSPKVLIPRPESEAMFDVLKTLPVAETIIDVGTGSGALAVTAQLEYPPATVYATDIDPACLNIARQNAETHGTNIQFIQSDLLEVIPPEAFGERTVLLANLPYVPHDYPVNTAATHEPALALYADSNGLALYERLFTQLQARPIRPQAILCESLLMQHAALAAIAMRYQYQLLATEGLQQLYQPIP